MSVAGQQEQSSPEVGCGRICCTKLWDFSVSCLTWILNSFRCLCKSPTNCWTRLNSASRGPVVAEVSLVTFPAYLLDAWSFCRSTTRSCSNLAFSATVSSSFWKRETRGRGKIIPWRVPVVVRQAKVDDTIAERNGNLSISVLLIHLPGRIPALPGNNEWDD